MSETGQIRTTRSAGQWRVKSDQAAIPRNLTLQLELTSFVYGHIVMTMKKRTIPAGRFKAECLALLDGVADTGESAIVTKHGRPVAEVVALRTRAPRTLRGSVSVRGDLVAPCSASGTSSVDCPRHPRLLWWASDLRSWADWPATKSTTRRRWGFRRSVVSRSPASPHAAGSSSIARRSSGWPRRISRHSLRHADKAAHRMLPDRSRLALRRSIRQEWRARWKWIGKVVVPILSLLVALAVLMLRGSLGS